MRSSSLSGEAGSFTLPEGAAAPVSPSAKTTAVISPARLRTLESLLT